MSIAGDADSIGLKQSLLKRTSSTGSLVIHEDGVNVVSTPRLVSLLSVLQSDVSYQIAALPPSHLKLFHDIKLVNST